MSRVLYEPMGEELFGKIYGSVSKREELDVNTTKEETDHLYNTVFWHMCESTFCEVDTAAGDEELSESEEVGQWQDLLSSCGQFYEEVTENYEMMQLVAEGQHECGREITPDQACVLSHVAIALVVKEAYRIIDKFDLGGLTD